MRSVCIPFSLLTALLLKEVNMLNINTPPQPLPFDFTEFETTVFPQWLRLFQLKNSTGEFVNRYNYVPNIIPGVGKATMYGSSDVIHMLFAMGKLELLSTNDKAEWIAHLQSFQNETITCWSTKKIPCPGFAKGTQFNGFWRLDPLEQAGWEPWHSSAEAPSALLLLGARQLYRNLMYEEIASNQSLWIPTIQPLVNVSDDAGCDNFHSCAHKLIGLAAAVAMYNATSATNFSPFLHWMIGYLDEHVDKTIGLWCSSDDRKHNLYNCLGGSFAAHLFHTAMNASWPLSQAVQATSLALQNTSGFWRNGTGYMNIDGIYQATRPLATNTSRKGAVSDACEAYLRTIHSVFADLKTMCKYNLCDNTHQLAASVAAISECQRVFPSLVKTNQIWRFTGDYAPFL
eukprot:m.4888 g.4888  ORF g.4888 m.4888 type:complete len:401 (-) comp3127_c0_seq1:91-1293(-)